MGNLFIGDYMMKKIRPILLILFFLIIYVYICNITMLPSNIVVFQGEEINLKTVYGLNIKNKNSSYTNYNAMQTATNLSEKVSDNIGTVNLSLDLFGTIPLKEIDVSVIPITKEGLVDLEELKKELTDQTILVSICSVDSELGTIQPIEKIGTILKDYPNCVFHTDATQAIGKTEIDFSKVDFITFAPHKFYGLNGFGCLINRHNVKLVPLIHGGKSTTIYRSGTPVVANVIALEKAFLLATSNLKEREEKIKKLNKKLRGELSKYKSVHINSPINSIPNTLNISLTNLNNIEVVKLLEEKEIYVSTTTACSLGDMPSKSVMAITNDLNLASNTIRISMSHYTKEDDIDTFIKEFTNIINN